MKTRLRKVVLGTLMVAGLPILAQPTLTQANCAPAVGGKLTYKLIAYTTPGGTGANQTWDLSQVTSSSTDTTKFVTASSTSNGSSYSLANICGASLNSAYSYYNVNSAAWQNYGTVAPSGIVMVYSDPEDLLQFPFTYNNTFSDNWAGTFISSGYKFYRTGKTTVTADGYGTLKLPNGTYKNVLRIHLVQAYKDSAFIGYKYIASYNNDQYMWYLPGNQGGVASVYNLTANGGSFTGGYYSAGIATGFSELSAISSFSIFPNPAKEEINIKLELNQAKKVEVKLYSSLGETVAVSAVSEGLMAENEYKMETGNLPDGIYFAEINLDGVAVSSRRFIVLK